MEQISDNLNGIRHACVVTWVAVCVGRNLPLFETVYTDEGRVRQAIESALDWVACPCDSHREAARRARIGANDAMGIAHTGTPDDEGSDAWPAAIAARTIAWAARNVANSVSGTWWADGVGVMVALGVADSVRNAPGAYTQERIWQMRCLAELCGFTPSDTEIEFVVTMLNDGWDGPVIELFELSPAACRG